MLHEEEPAGPHGIMDLIATLSAGGASGRLELVAAGTEGALLFRGGKLVDAHLGHLTGFQAVNALASMRDAQFYFDPSVAVPTTSSITPSERVVLKRFFGIETADSQDHSAPPLSDRVDETTLVGSSVVTEPASELTDELISAPASERGSEPADTAAIYHAPRGFRYAAVFALGLLLIAVAAAAVLLREKFRERSLPDTVAANTETVSPPAPTEPRVNETSSSTATPRSTEMPRSTATRPSTAPDLTGDWTIVNTVNTTSHRSFQNLRIGFALSINQSGTTFTAKGQKVSENGRSLPASSRTPIELKGSIKGDRIEATFSERGALRKTNGRFVWRIDRAGSGLSGTFASTAAKTSGKSTATREL